MTASAAARSGFYVEYLLSPLDWGKEQRQMPKATQTTIAARREVVEEIRQTADGEYEVLGE